MKPDRYSAHERGVCAVAREQLPEHAIVSRCWGPADEAVNPEVATVVGVRRWRLRSWPWCYRMMRAFNNSRLRAIAAGFLLAAGRRVLVSPTQGWRLQAR